MPEKEKMYRQTAFHSFRLGWWYLAVQIRRTQSTAKKATVAASTCKYAKTNVNEFWAEVCTKAVHGKADKYTKAAKDIIKKYKL